MQRVGIIGLGLVGTAISRRLLASGHEVIGYDIAETQRAALNAAGGRAVDSAASVAEACNVVLLSLPDSSVVARVLDEIARALRPGMLIVDTTTGDPHSTEAACAQLADHGVDYLDATIVGSSAQVAAGEAIVMVGGRPAAFTAIAALLATFSSDAFHVGPCGAGSRMKLVVNLVLGLNRAVLAEGLTLAEALGLDPAVALDMLRASAAYSRVMDTKGPKMLSGDFTPQARLSQHLKDVRLILAAAERTGTELPLSLQHRELLERAEALGFGPLDNSAIVRAFRAGRTST